MSTPGDPAGRQTRIEREEFARGRRPPGAEPVSPRPAATIVVARAAGVGFEVLLLERASTARFAAGAFAFPGGVVDPADEDPAWSARLPVVAGAEPGPCAAAIRELFEETGLLLSEIPPGALDRLDAARSDLLADRRSFPDIVRALDLGFADARLAYFARWVTPERLARRYDTRFFFAAMTAADAPIRLTPEHTSALWASPATALGRFRQGDLPMLFPTWKTLEMLARYGTLEEALSELRAAPVRTVLPRLRVAGEAVRPLLPGDPGYEEAG